MTSTPTWSSVEMLVHLRCGCTVLGLNLGTVLGSAASSTTSWAGLSWSGSPSRKTATSPPVATASSVPVTFNPG